MDMMLESLLPPSLLQFDYVFGHMNTWRVGLSGILSEIREASLYMYSIIVVEASHVAHKEKVDHNLSTVQYNNVKLFLSDCNVDVYNKIDEHV